MIRRVVRFAITAALVTALTTSVTADGNARPRDTAGVALPNYNVAPLCHAFEPQTADTFEHCMADEKNARDELGRVWPQFATQDQKLCNANARISGAKGASYVDLLICLHLMDDARHAE